MAFNLQALSGFAQAVAGHPAGKASAVATVISAALYAAQVAGAPVPSLALLVGPVVGSLVYALLPPKEKQEVDAVIDKVEEVATEIPTTYPEYPAAKNGAFPTAPAAQGPANSNINQLPVA